LILVDSSVWIDYFKGTITAQTEILDRLLGQQPLAIGDLILTEVLQGFDSERDFNDARKMLTSLTVVELGGQEIAIQAAKNFRELRRLGVTVRKTIDTVIATRCIESGYDLLQQRPGFRSVREAPRVFAVSDKFQPELAADSHSSALKSVQCNARIGGIEQPVERSAAGLHAEGHGRLGEAILLHGGFDLIGEDLLDGLLLALFQNALFGQKVIKR